MPAAIRNGREREAERLDRRVARLEPAPGARVEHAEHDRGQARRGQQRAHLVELGARAAAVVGQPAQAEQDADHHDDLAREHDAPREVGRHPAAEDRPDRDAGARHAAEHPVGERALLALEAAGGQRRQRGQHERGTDPLQHRPAQRQHRHAPRHRGEQRAGAVDHVADPERAPAPHDVAELAAGDHQRGHHQRVEGDDRLDAGDVGVEVLDQLRDGDVHHRLVEDHQELRGREDREDLHSKQISVRRERVDDHEVQGHDHDRPGRIGVEEHQMGERVQPRERDAHHHPDVLQLHHLRAGPQHQQADEDPPEPPRAEVAEQQLVAVEAAVVGERDDAVEDVERPHEDQHDAGEGHHAVALVQRRCGGRGCAHVAPPGRVRRLLGGTDDEDGSPGVLHEPA